MGEGREQGVSGSGREDEAGCEWVRGGSRVGVGVGGRMKLGVSGCGEGAGCEWVRGGSRV